MSEDTHSISEEMSDAKRRQIANLKPVKPGEVRNPAGRGKGNLNTATIIKKFLLSKEAILKDPITGKPSRRTQLEIITLRMIQEARDGNVQAFNTLLDRVDGKPVQKSIVAGDPDGAPIVLERQIFIMPNGQEIVF